MKEQLTDKELLTAFDDAVSAKYNQIHNTLKGVKKAFEKGAGYGVVYANSLITSKEKEELKANIQLSRAIGLLQGVKDGLKYPDALNTEGARNVIEESIKILLTFQSPIP